MTDSCMHAPRRPERAVLLPGWGTDLARLEPLGGDLRVRGYDVDLHAYLPQGSITTLADRLARELDDDDRPLHLLGHSLGGLVVAAAALGPLADRVETVTTINSPWRGTWLGYTGSGPLAQALRWGTDELAALRARLRQHLGVPDGPRWLLLGTAGDLGVTPFSALRAAPGGGRLTTAVAWVVGHSVSLLQPPLRQRVVDHVAGAAALVE